MSKPDNWINTLDIEKTIRDLSGLNSRVKFRLNTNKAELPLIDLNNGNSTNDLYTICKDIIQGTVAEKIINKRVKIIPDGIQNGVLDLPIYDTGEDNVVYIMEYFKDFSEV